MAGFPSLNDRLNKISEIEAKIKAISPVSSTSSIGKTRPAFNLPLSPSGKSLSETGDGDRRPSSASASIGITVNNSSVESNGSHPELSMSISEDNSLSSAANSSSALSPRSLDFSNSKRDMKLTPSSRKVPQNLPSLPGLSVKSPDSVEIERKYQEIMKQCGILSIGNEKIKCEPCDLQPVDVLGQGTCGHVVKMRHKTTGHLMAVKQMRRTLNPDENKRIIMDLDVVIKCHSCEFIVQCIGTFISPSDVWICMELMTTCFDKLLKQLKEPIPEKICGKVAVATLNALNYLKEEHGVIHRDVKPSNILLDEQGHIKLCDFGISGHLVDSRAKTRSAGCAAYLSPERIEPPDPEKPDYDIRADVWALGISLVELATGIFPYAGCHTDFELLSKIIQDASPKLPRGRGFSMDFGSFIDLCLIKKSQDRPKYNVLLEHSFIKRFKVLNVDVRGWFAEVKPRLGPLTTAFV